MHLNKGPAEELGAIIGTEATIAVIAWLDGRPLDVPKQPTREHWLNAVLSPDPDTAYELLCRLCATYAVHRFYPPKVSMLEYMRKRRQICEMLKKGVSNRLIAHHVGLSERQIRNHRRWLEQKGLLPYILTTKEPEQADMFENLPQDSPGTQQAQAMHG